MPSLGTQVGEEQTWVHVVYAWTRSNGTLYVNGTLAGSIELPEDGGSVPEDIWINYDGESSSNDVNGNGVKHMQWNHVEVFDFALNETQARESYAWYAGDPACRVDCAPIAEDAIVKAHILIPSASQDGDGDGEKPTTPLYADQTQVFWECDPGYERTDGHHNTTCSMGELVSREYVPKNSTEDNEANGTGTSTDEANSAGTSTDEANSASTSTDEANNTGSITNEANSTGTSTRRRLTEDDNESGNTADDDNDGPIEMIIANVPTKPLQCCALTSYFCPLDFFNVPRLLKAHHPTSPPLPLACDEPLSNIHEIFGTLGSRVMLSCEAGFDLGPRVNDTLVTCGQEGRWQVRYQDALKPECTPTPKWCAYPQNPDQLNIIVEGLHVGARTRFLCPRAHLPRELVVTCSQSHDWEGDAMESCVPFEPSVALAGNAANLNATTVSNTTTLTADGGATLGSEARFQCPRGTLRVHGDVTASCSRDGWQVGNRSMDPVTCELEEQFCEPFEVDHAVVRYSGHSIGSHATIYCLQPYLMTPEGESHFICDHVGLGLGRWTDAVYRMELPRAQCTFRTHWCNDTQAVLDMPHTVTDPSVVISTFDARVSLACVEGYIRVHGDTNLRCNMDGQWEKAADGVNTTTTPSVTSHPPRPLLCTLDPEYCANAFPTLEHASVTHLTNGFREGSLASIRCHVAHTSDHPSGVQQDDGVITEGGGTLLTLTCKNTVWVDAATDVTVTDYRCTRLPEYCPYPDLSQFPLTQLNVSADAVQWFPLGAAIEASCLPGFEKNYGHEVYRCGVGPAWVTVDGIAAEMLVCRSSIGMCQTSVRGLLSQFPNTIALDLQPIARSLHAQVTLGCAPGYEPMDQTWTLTCCISAQWELSCDAPGAPITMTCTLNTSVCDPIVTLEPNVVVSPTNTPAEILATRVSSCPAPSFVLHGDEQVQCTYDGTWRAPMKAGGLALMTHTTVVCGQRDYNGVKIQSESFSQILPTLSMERFEYERATMRAYVQPRESYTYTFHLRVKGKAVVRFDGQILGSFGSEDDATGQWRDFDIPGQFPLVQGQFYEIVVDYITLSNHAGLELQWTGPNGKELIPQELLLHSLSSVQGFPRPLRLVNDTMPCAPETEFMDILPDVPIIISSSQAFGAGKYYEPNLHCLWKFETFERVKYDLTITVKTFELEESPNCEFDVLNIYFDQQRYNQKNTIGTFCGTYGENTELLVKNNNRLVVEFISDHKGERRGFEITITPVDNTVVVPP